MPNRFPDVCDEGLLSELRKNARKSFPDETSFAQDVAEQLMVLNKPWSTYAAEPFSEEQLEE